MCKILDIRGRAVRLRERARGSTPPTPTGYELDPAITREHLVAVRDLSDCNANARRRQDLGHEVGVTQQPGKVASVSLYHPDTAYLKSLMPMIEQQVAHAGWPIRVSATWLYINLDLKHVRRGAGWTACCAGCEREWGGLRDEASIPTGRRRTQRRGSRGSETRPATCSIRERCGFFACLANAQDEIKRAADYVSTLDEPRGVLDI